MGALVYSTLPLNGYAITADSGSIRDPENLFVTRRRSIVYRGKEEDLIKRFPIGAQSSPSGGGNMLCAGPSSIQLCEGTAADPHWETEIQWIGLHASYSSGELFTDNNFNYRVLSNCSRTETEFPKTVTKDDGSSVPILIGTDFVNTVAVVAGVPTRARLINFVPSLQVIGVIYNPGNLTLLSPRIKQLITTLNGSYQPPANLIQDWSALPGPLRTYAAQFLPKTMQSGKMGAYVPASLESHRHLSFGPIHAFTMQLTWEQGITPG